MAVYGIGAYYDSDVSQDFINSEVVGVGWGASDAPELQEYFKSLKVGDIVYIKAAFGQNDITVKAIGLIKDNEILINYPINSNYDLITTGRRVKWLYLNRFRIKKPVEKNNVRSNTVYEEFHPEVLKQIIDKI